MTSPLASAIRTEQRRFEASLGPLARLHLAQRLGDEAVVQYARAHRVAPQDAAREFRRRRQLGRRPSGCLAGR